MNYSNQSYQAVLPPDVSSGWNDPPSVAGAAHSNRVAEMRKHRLVDPSIQGASNYGAYAHHQQQYGHQGHGANPYGAPQQNQSSPYGAPPQQTNPYGVPQQNQAVPYGAPPQGQGAPGFYGAAQQYVGPPPTQQGNQPSPTFGYPPAPQANVGINPMASTTPVPYGAPPALNVNPSQQSAVPYGTPLQPHQYQQSAPVAQQPASQPSPQGQGYGAQAPVAVGRATPVAQESQQPQNPPAQYGQPNKYDIPFGAPPQSQQPYQQQSAPGSQTSPQGQAYATNAANQRATPVTQEMQVQNNANQYSQPTNQYGAPPQGQQYQQPAPASQSSPQEQEYPGQTQAVNQRATPIAREAQPQGCVYGASPQQQQYGGSIQHTQQPYGMPPQQQQMYQQQGQGYPMAQANPNAGSYNSQQYNPYGAPPQSSVQRM